MLQLQLVQRPLRAATSLLIAAAAVASASCRPSPAPPSSELRILVYNIHAGKDRGGRDNIDRVAGIVRLAGSDVAFLQEVDSVTERSGWISQLDTLAHATGLRGVFGRTLNYQGGGYGIATLTRLPIIRDSMISLPVIPAQQRAGGSYEPRGLLEVITVLGGDTIALLNTHLDPSGDDRFRRQEVATIIVHAKAHAASGMRVLVGGDFNSTPESAVQEMLREAGFHDLWAECGRGPGLTYPDTVPLKRIDYLFHLGGFRCQRTMVLDSLASDHRPLLVILRRD